MFIVKDIISGEIYSIDIFVIESDIIHFTSNNNISFLSPLTFSEFNKSSSNGAILYSGITLNGINHLGNSSLSYIALLMILDAQLHL